MRSEERLARVDEARAVIEKCKTRDGFRAGVHLYPELWIRDLVYSEEALLRLGYAETVKKHLESFVRLQRSDGNLPTVVTSGLGRTLAQRFHFWTSDTEILFVIGAHMYAAYARDPGFLESIDEPISRCVRFISGRLNEWGLIPGSDWRDAVIGLEGKLLLSNQMQLVSMYELLGENDRAGILRDSVRKHFFIPDLGYFADSVWFEDGTVRRDLRFDCLGSALGVLNGTIAGAAAAGTREGFRLAESAFGYRNVSPPYQVNRIEGFRSVGSMNAFVRSGAWLRNRPGHYQNSAVWPFVEARVVSALRNLGATSEAEAASDRLLARLGVNEWYSPATGKPRGSGGQLWTAAAIITQT